jgi:hypothetical protein
MLDFVCAAAGVGCSAPMMIARAATCTFLAIVFLQSGIDKIIDRGGNVDWLTGHFAKSPLAGFVPAMVTTVTVVELAAGATSALAAITLPFGAGTALAVTGCALSAVALLMLLFGQRMAKDYAGAAVLAPYFLVAIAGLFLLA